MHTITITERQGDFVVVVSKRATPDGRMVLLIETNGAGSSFDFATCLARIGEAGVFSRRTLAILDNSKAQRETEAQGLFAQAEILARARIQTLYLCYLADTDTESTAALEPMISEIFQRAGIRTAIHICPSQDDALNWLAAQP